MGLLITNESAQIINTEIIKVFSQAFLVADVQHVKTLGEQHIDNYIYT